MSPLLRKDGRVWCETGSPSFSKNENRKLQQHYENQTIKAWDFDHRDRSDIIPDLHRLRYLQPWNLGYEWRQTKAF